HPLQAHPAVASRHVPHPVLEPGDGLVGDATAWRALFRQRKAEEGALPWMSHGALLRVDLKLETPFDEACDACHHPPASRLAAHVDIAVICVTNKTVAATLKFAIQFIQHEIREQRREWTALRSPLPAVLEQPVVEHTGRQIASNKPK